MSLAPELATQLHDIQAVVGNGFGWLQSSRFTLLTIGSPDAARTWLRRLRTSGLLLSVADIQKNKGQARRSVREVAAVAFSGAGLARLGLVESTDFPFPTPFRSGMASPLRETLLRDSGQGGWHWGDTESSSSPAHILLAHWWQTGIAPIWPEPDPSAFAGWRHVAGCPSYFRPGLDRSGCAARADAASLKLHEPFGFRDGIAQPVIRGLRDETDTPSGPAMADAGEFYRDRVIAPGEFLLGYRNEYDQLSAVPDAAGWAPPGEVTTQPGARFGQNGSFLAVRQIEQHVTAFRATEAASGGARFPGDASLAEKIVGRRKDMRGTPLVWPASACPVSDSHADAFRYRVADADGFGCPRGAHIRRANPRDTLAHDVASGIESSKLHRLLRRGRPYRAVSDDGTETEGIFFIACNADLERQFEFILQRWLHNPRFADLEDQADPLVDPSPRRHRYVVPQQPVGEAPSLASFTTTRGGGYFFLPGLRALDFLIDGIRGA